MISQSATRHKQMFTCGKVLIRFHRKDAEAQRGMTMDGRLSTTDNGPWTTDYGRQRMDSRLRVQTPIINSQLSTF